MRAIQVTRFGGPEVLVATRLPDPVAGPGQVVVRVEAADVILFEARIRAGLAQDFMPVRPPYVPGGAVAGRVLSVGEGVGSDWVGRAVAARLGDRGGYAELALAPVEALVAVPDGLGPREAAALLHDGTTALGLADAARTKPGEWVLVTGAGGGLGILMVQLALAAGERVVAAARGKRKLDLLAELGAHAVVDYSLPGWEERVREATGGAGPDMVYDGVGGEIGRSAFELTARGGQFSAHGAAAGGFASIDPEEARRREVAVRGIEQAQFTPDTAHRLLRRVLAEAAAGRIRPVIGQTFPLERAADAHRAMEGRDVVGKTLLLP
ncbi:zinc-binding dehydrogenase [Streptomyces sp. H39-S7]|uniref:zinc-binding dehydrogenase n=1 Tax=Streptomyces sp. H39-S7 TaxID=3004357 RepID=UPI0022AEE9FB|nr:zinc-binding dehydrogenase [Streptomyces sp. H39-S7]MCZ4118749.1 zinc-binding dehydrogenase [Streptomyces sp. H39-S7]